MARRRRRIFVVNVDVREPSSSAEDRVLARDLLRKLRFATSPDCWDAWIAHAEGKTLVEISAETGIPLSTVAWRVNRARLDFAAAIGRLRASERRRIR